MTKEISILDKLPNDGQKVACFGHKTFCCKLDMDEEPDWHVAIFTFVLSAYKLKKEMPADPEESILEYCNFVERWSAEEDPTYAHIIGVTKWKKLDD